MFAYVKRKIKPDAPEADFFKEKTRRLARFYM